MPTVAAATEYLDHLRVLVLLQGCDRHGPRAVNSSQNGAGNNSNREKIFHPHPPVPKVCSNTREMTDTADRAHDFGGSEMGASAKVVVQPFTRL